MNLSLKVIPANVDQAVSELRQAAAAKKCWHCGCLHSTLQAIDDEIHGSARPRALEDVVADARKNLLAAKYDCLGCEVCWPANAVNALGIEGDACPAEPVQAQEGWPCLPGSYTVLRYHAPVAVCTLTDESLAASLAASNDSAIAIVGTMFTENLGIERLIENVLANPNIRFVIVCGNDSGRQIGHLAGQSLVSLARNGVDEREKIIGARGKRPRMQNLTTDAIEHFRRNIEVIDLVGVSDVQVIARHVAKSAERNTGPAPVFASERIVPRIEGRVPARMVSDPAGYFVVYPDRPRKRLLLEHYQNNGVLDFVVEGACAAELYMTAIERHMISRLDHAAYLGRELARAERSLTTSEAYVQDAAPERGNVKPAKPCGRGSACAGSEGENHR